MTTIYTISESPTFIQIYATTTTRHAGIVNQVTSFITVEGGESVEKSLDRLKAKHAYKMEHPDFNDHD